MSLLPMYYKEGDDLFMIANDQNYKHIIAELQDGYLVVFSASFDTIFNLQVEFVKKDAIDENYKAKKGVTKL